MHVSCRFGAAAASGDEVGWAIADHMRTSLVIDALDMALARHSPPAGVIFHSDYAEVFVKPRTREMACVGRVS